MDEKVDRRNGRLFLWGNLMIYLAAPVFYVDVVQAALCHKLGASATVANLPAAFNLLGNIAPLLFACLIPHRWERTMAAWPNYLIAGLLALVGAMLIVPMDDSVRIAGVIGESLVYGMLNSVAQIYMMQCLGRGTTERGRAHALKLTFTFGPIAAVASSLGAQVVLRHEVPGLFFPRDFAFLHLYAVPCSLVTGWCCSRFELAPIAEPERPAFLGQFRDMFRDYVRAGPMILLFLAYLLFNCAINATANLSLFTQQAIGRDPSEFSGLILAIRFGTKALAGYGLGLLYLRHGFRAPLIATVALTALAMIWPLAVPGYPFLAAFGLMGAGELAGVYFPNLVLSWSPATSATRDMAILGLAVPLSCPSPALFGFITDHLGFRASFVAGLALALAALGLVLRLPSRKAQA